MAQFIRKLFSQPSVSIQILSDLHLEVNQQYTSFDVPVVSKYLLLAGDIGRLADYDQYLHFLQRKTEKFELVFLVLSNHEFYGESFESAFETAKRLEQEPSLNGRLILLQQRRDDIPDSYNRTWVYYLVRYTRKLQRYCPLYNSEFSENQGLDGRRA